VVFHPSWGYFADDYGLRQLAIEVDGKVPSDAEISRLQRRARELGITVVYVQPQIAGQALHAVADSIGARVETLDPLAPDVIANLRQTATEIAGSFDD
jgi:zinc transport system substrate-binding protein